MKYIHDEYLTPHTTDVLKPSQHRRSLHLTHYQASLPVNTQKHLHYHCLIHAALVRVQMRATFKSSQTAVNASRTVVRRRISTRTGVLSATAAHPPADIFIALSLQWREMVRVARKNFRFDQYCYSVMCMLCSSACQRLALRSSTNPRSIMSSPLPSDEHLLSVLCRLSQL